VPFPRSSRRGGPHALAHHYTFGRDDFVVVMDLPSEAALAKAQVEIQKGGTVTIETLTAMSPDKVYRAVKELRPLTGLPERSDPAPKGEGAPDRHENRRFGFGSGIFPARHPHRGRVCGGCLFLVPPAVSHEQRSGAGRRARRQPAPPRRRKNAARNAAKTTIMAP
jgi:GYD domain